MRLNIRRAGQLGRVPVALQPGAGRRVEQQRGGDDRPYA